MVGDSGGAPDAVHDGETGYVVDGRSPARVAAVIGRLLADPEESRAMGRRGRAWVEANWRWEVLAGRLGELLAG